MQSRTMSLVEAITNVVVGYGVAVGTQILIFPIFGLQVTLTQNFMMGAIFTIVSITRSYVLRRLFEALQFRHSVMIGNRSFGAHRRQQVAVLNTGSRQRK